MLRRTELVALIDVDVRGIVGAVDASDSQDAIALQRDLEKHLPYLRSADYRVLTDCVLVGAKLARELWRDAEQDDSLWELFETEQAILDERRHLEGQRAEGMQQSTMALTFRKRQV
jgi:hypothetical protein